MGLELVEIIEEDAGGAITFSVGARAKTETAVNIFAFGKLYYLISMKGLDTL